MSNPEAGRVRRHAAVARLLQQQFVTQTPDEIKKAVEHNTRLLGHGCYRSLPVPDVPSLVFTGRGRHPVQPPGWAVTAPSTTCRTATRSSRGRNAQSSR